MVAYIMIAVLSVLAFLCISQAIPGMARRKTAPSYRPRERREGTIQK